MLLYYQVHWSEEDMGHALDSVRTGNMSINQVGGTGLYCGGGDLSATTLLTTMEGVSGVMICMFVIIVVVVLVAMEVMVIWR